MEKSDLTAVYWIRKKEHTNIYEEGYVGVSSNIKRRWRDHITEAKNNKHPNAHLGRAINKYYPDNLVFEIVYLSNEDKCYKYEEYLRPDTNIGWNLRSGGPVGKMSEEGRKRVSELAKKRIITEAQKLNRRYKNFLKKNLYVTKSQYIDLMCIKNKEVYDRRKDSKVFCITTAEVFNNVYEAENEDKSAFDIFMECENNGIYMWFEELQQ